MKQEYVASIISDMNFKEDLRLLKLNQISLLTLVSNIVSNVIMYDVSNGSHIAFQLTLVSNI